MTTPEGHIPIAPAPRHGYSLLSPPGPDSHMPPMASLSKASTASPDSGMPYNCQPCVRRKVKCDRTTPMCSSCAKSRQDCFYQAPPKPRRKKRKADDGTDAHDDKPKDEDELRDRLVRYEHVLRENGLLSSADAAQPVSSRPTPQTSVNQDSPAPSPVDPLKRGKLVSVGGKTRYIDSRIWLESGEDSIHECEGCHENEPDDSAQQPQEGQIHETEGPMYSYDPVSGALLGCNVNLLEFHPGHRNAMKLWKSYAEYVEPLVRIVHSATTAKMVETVSQKPETASKAQECLLFAIYMFAVVALTEEDCQREYGQSRDFLLKRYSYGLKQALVNARWLATTDIMVLQAFVLFLIAMRGHLDFYDAHTFWIFTGVAVRIAQRMGLHRDGESLGLPPFEVQMRRRLFWQILPLEGFAGQHSGTGIALSTSSWDTKKPLNINDSDIYPGMTQMPEESKGATDMMYVMARNELTDLFVRKVAMRDDLGEPETAPLNSRVLKMVDVVEDYLEQKVFRYCDAIVPLHLQTLMLVRAAINATRLRHQIQSIRDNTIDDAGRTRLCILAQKVIDVDIALHANPRLKNFLWQIKSPFLWDAVICMLMSLNKKDFYTGAWLDATWDRLSQFYTNHPEILTRKYPLQASAVKATLEAWMANPPSNNDPEPEYITNARASRNDRAQRRLAHCKIKGDEEEDGTGRKSLDQQRRVDPQVPGMPGYQPGSFENWGGLNAANVFDMPMSPGIGDWGFWDQFFQQTTDHG